MGVQNIYTDLHTNVGCDKYIYMEGKSIYHCLKIYSENRIEEVSIYLHHSLSTIYM
jgi:hypothetical protein